MLKSAPGGVSALGGVCSQGRVSAPGGCLLGGVSAPGGRCLLPGGGVCSQGVSAPEGCLLWGGVVSALGGGLLPGGYIPPCTEADTHPPCGQTDACENITLAQLRCGR